MVISRAQIYWVDLGTAEDGSPAGTRPALIIQSDSYNSSRIATTLGAVITGNERLAAMPGNVFLPKEATGLPKNSVVNVTALITLDKSDCVRLAGTVPAHLMREVDRGLGLVLDL